MPNHCENDLRLDGPKDAVLEAVEKMRGDSQLIDFGTAIPYPKRFSDQDEAAAAFEGDSKDRPRDGFNAGGYEWCCENWGTKWNAYELPDEWEAGFEFDKEGTPHLENHNLSFNTAWAPPKPVIVAWSKMHREIEFELRYFDQGGQFNGVLVVKGGSIETDETGKYFGNRGG